MVDFLAAAAQRQFRLFRMRISSQEAANSKPSSSHTPGFGGHSASGNLNRQSSSNNNQFNSLYQPNSGGLDQGCPPNDYDVFRSGY